MKNKKIVTSIGGQALIEGIMMRGPKKTSIAVRTPNQDIEVEDLQTEYLQDKVKLFKYPFFRGIGTIIDSLKIGQKALTISAEKSTDLTSAEEQSKFEKWLDKTFGDKIMKVVIGVASVFGVALAILLFFFLPNWLFNVTLGQIEGIGDVIIYRSISEGVLKFLIFLGYLILCSQLKDIKRVFKYHGAEHKSIFCYEAGEELTVENVRKHSRFHPRCGTSFIVVMLLVGILIGFFIPFQNSFARAIARIICVPIMVSLGYEIIRLCGKHDNKLTRIIAKPGIWMQKITTKEPDDDMIEVAIKALVAVIPEHGEDRIRYDSE
ncbi:MAG: hypothetical protein RUMPE_00193 [Eubacteriales bacterium SKADARSKE-1]|nr:hypothetical protein [Eubacteriales bacterium SKADARSKE-1]